MAKPNYIELGSTLVIPILYEDRAVLAMDKPPGWMLAPTHWEHTGRNLPLALESSLRAGDFWARSRNLKFLRHVHRLDADTSGVLLFVKSHGALAAYSRLFESRQVEKMYLAVMRGVPRETEWTCHLKIAPDPKEVGRMKVDQRQGQETETRFRVLKTKGDVSLVEARPFTGRTHQIRVHLAATGHPVLGDRLYGPEAFEGPGKKTTLALRAVFLSYPDPFTRRVVRIQAPSDKFVRAFGFEDPAPA